MCPVDKHIQCRKTAASPKCLATHGLGKQAWYWEAEVGGTVRIQCMLDVQSLYIEGARPPDMQSREYVITQASR